MTDTNKMAQYVANWQDERNGAALYRAISEVEKNPQLKSVYQRLAEAEERHSCFWEAKLRAARQLASIFQAQLAHAHAHLPRPALRPGVRAAQHRAARAD